MIHTVVITSRLHLLSIMTESGSNPIYFFLKIVIVDENIGSYSNFLKTKSLLMEIISPNVYVYIRHGF